MVTLTMSHFLKFLFHILTIKQAIEIVSGNCLCYQALTSQGTDNTAKMDETRI